MEETPPYSTGQRCAVVTGGNKGIGLEICRQLACNGVFVILTARDEKRGVGAVENLKAAGYSNVVFHQLDVTNSSSIASLANFIHTHFKKLDILVNNAAELGVIIDGDAFRALPYGFDSVNNAADIGLQIDGEALKALPDTFENVRDKNPELLTAIMKETYENAEECLKTNYYGTKAVTEALLPFLQLSNTANIVNVSSVYGLLKHIPNENVRLELNNVESLTEERLNELLQCFLKDFKEEKVQANGWPDRVTAYKISKAAVNAYTRILARRFPSIRINCVNPGFVKTDLTYNLGLLTTEEGAKGPVMAALLPSNGPSGRYFDKMNVSTF